MKLTYLLIMTYLTYTLVSYAQVDIKKEDQKTYLDNYGRFKPSLIRQGPSSGLNCDFLDSYDSWQFLRSSAPATFYGNLGLSTTAPRAMLAVDGGGHFTSSVTALSFFGDGSGLTNLGGASLSGGSTSYIQNINTLQASSTFYVTSGTIDGQTLLARSSGNVGIGVSIPTNKLQVSAIPNDGIYIGTGTTSAFGGGEVGIVIQSQGSRDMVDMHLVGATGADPKFFFRQTSTYPITFGTSNVENMRIAGTGNIGISTTNPVAKLSVVGDAYFENGVTSNISFTSPKSTSTNSFATNAYSTTSFSDISRAYTQFIVMGGVRSEYRVNASTGKLQECGTSPAFRGNDFAGKITMGTPMSASALCNFKFGAGFADPPICVLTMDDNLSFAIASVTVTDMTIRTNVGLASAEKVNFVCIDN